MVSGLIIRPFRTWDNEAISVGFSVCTSYEGGTKRMR